MTSNADISLDNVNYDDLLDLTAIRLFGITPEDLAKKLDTADTSLLEQLVITLINVLGINQPADPKANYLKVVTLRRFIDVSQKLIPNQIPDFDFNSFGSEVYFYARQNGKLVSSRQVYSLLSQGLAQLVSSKYTVNLNSFLFDACQLNSNKVDGFCPIGSACKTAFMTSRQSITVDANATSLVTLDNQVSAECYSNAKVWGFLSLIK